MLFFGLISPSQKGKIYAVTHARESKKYELVEMNGSAFPEKDHEDFALYKDSVI